MKSSSVSECVHKKYPNSMPAGQYRCMKCDKWCNEQEFRTTPQSGKSDKGVFDDEPLDSGKSKQTTPVSIHSEKDVNKLDSEKEWESILKLGIIDEDEGTITFSYNELVNLLEGK